MSKFEDNVYKALKKAFPFTTIQRQLYVNYNHTRLFFDFYIRRLNLYIECQGNQHFKFNRFMHGTVIKYKEAVRRDKLKEAYVDEMGGTLITLNYDDYKDIDSEGIIEVIHSHIVGD